VGEWWAANWFNVVGVVLGLLGIPGLWLGWKSWRMKKPVYVISSNNLFSDLGEKVPDVSVRFTGYGDPIKALTVTKIALWNKGNETITKQDMVKEDPLCIKAAEGVVILSASILQTTTPFNKFDLTVNKDRNRVTVGFEYMDESHGVVIQIFHTGKGSEDLHVQGTFKGINGLVRRVLHPRDSPQEEKAQKTTLALLGGLGCLLMVPIMFAGLFAGDREIRVGFLQWLTLGIFAYSLVASAFALWLRSARVPRALSTFTSKES
jgi:hypothetical protein